MDIREKGIEQSVISPNVEMACKERDPTKWSLIKVQHHCCDVASNIILINLLKTELLQNELQPQLIRCNTSVVADTANQSLTVSVSGP